MPPSISVEEDNYVAMDPEADVAEAADEATEVVTTVKGVAWAAA